MRTTEKKMKNKFKMKALLIFLIASNCRFCAPIIITISYSNINIIIHKIINIILFKT